MGWPAIKRTGDAGLPGSGFMPFAEGACAVAVQAHHLRQRRDPVRDLTRVARKSRRGFHDRARVGRVMVASGFKRIASG